MITKLKRHHFRFQIGELALNITEEFCLIFTPVQLDIYFTIPVRVESEND